MIGKHLTTLADHRGVEKASGFCLPTPHPNKAKPPGLMAGGFALWGGRWDPGPCFSRGGSRAQPLVPLPRKAVLFRLLRLRGKGVRLLLTDPSPEQSKTPGLMAGGFALWGGRWDSNPRSSVPQTDALGQLRYTHHVGAPEGTRTPGPLLRRQVLYPAELQAHSCVPSGAFCWSG